MGMGWDRTPCKSKAGLDGQAQAQVLVLVQAQAQAQWAHGMDFGGARPFAHRHRGG